VASLVRFWMGRDVYQDLNAIQALCSCLLHQHHLTLPNLVYSYLPTTDPEKYEPLGTLGGYYRAPDLDYDLNGRRYGMYTHDWRRVAPMEFLEHMVKTGRPPRNPPILGAEAFAEAVRVALKHLHDPLRLAENPLIHSRMVEARARSSAADARAEALRSLVCESIASLVGTPKQRRLRDALEATFVNPAGTQEDAAEILDLPFSTYRRHLTEGTSEITALLWRDEIK
jgi:hypothetical protein